MTQTMQAPSGHTTTAAAVPWLLVLHGRDPGTGHLATWHAMPFVTEDGVSDLCTLERVAGDITHPAVWMQATKETFVVTRDELFELMRDVAVPS